MRDFRKIIKAFEESAHDNPAGSRVQTLLEYVAARLEQRSADMIGARPEELTTLQGMCRELGNMLSDLDRPKITPRPAPPPGYAVGADGKPTSPPEVG